ncbi:cbb3-type cytochrome oxidase assembly protein [Nevskia soli]|nr:cbb3-type cytochrome oxidase assembly protein [Nevskia soli]
MASLYLLIPLGVGVVLAAIGIFLWAAQRGQFDGLEDLSSRMPDDES